MILRTFAGLKKAGWLPIFFLSACTSHAPQFAVPEKISFGGQLFEKVSHSRIEAMQQLLYLPQISTKNPDDWQQGLLLFLDADRAKTLAERAALRQRHFDGQPQTWATVAIYDLNGKSELRGQVIYPPTERFSNVQLEVSRGQNMACGYGQMQFADKRAVSRKMLQTLSEFQPLVVKLASKFSQLAWQIECQ